MEQHIQRYTKYIHEDLYNIDINIATYKEHLHKSFEWFACIQLSVQYNSIFLCWEDVSPQLREEKGMIRDMGIDAWDIEGNRVSQMKLYQGCISWRHFATFLGCCFKFKDAIKILYRTQESQLCPLIQSYVTDKTIIDETVSGIDFREECKRIQILSFPSPKLSKTFFIRSYQIESISYLEKGKDANKNVYLSIPTGCGKTVIILQYHSNYRSERLLVLVPRIVLMEQWGEECMKLGIKPYLIGTGHHHNMEHYKDETIVICVYDSFPNIYEQKDSFGRYCIDEAHHIKTPERYMDTETDHIIYYDSDEVEDEENELFDDQKEESIPYMKGISSLWDTKNVIAISATLDPPIDDSFFFEYKVRQAIEDGYLCDYQFVFPIFEQEYITNEHLARYLIHIQHESHCVIYASNCKEGTEFTQLLNHLRKGCAGYIDADTPYKERQRLFIEFESGQLHFLVNIRILVEGFNAPHIKSIFFLHISISEIFIIQAIGRALRQYQNKQLATIYMPFSQESDLKRIQTLLHQLSTYDERIAKSISEKKIGGYLSLERGEMQNDEDDNENNDDTVSIFEFRYNLIVDRMGHSNQLEELAIKRALEYKAFYEEKQRKPILILQGKTKEQRDNATDEQKYEQKLAVWFSNMKELKKGISHRILYQSVEKILIKLLGEKWYEKTDFEDVALKRALEFKTFYEENQRYPVGVLKEKTKEQKENATDEQIYEHKLALWFQGMKTVNRGVKTTSRILYPSVEKIFIELLGKNWCSSLEDVSLKYALEYKRFYEENQRKPSKVLQGKTKEQKDSATEEKKYEQKLAQWLGNMKSSKKGKSRMNLYASVEKILIDLLGKNW
jgi:superfamily II DNA or RNA helicase